MTEPKQEVPNEISSITYRGASNCSVMDQTPSALTYSSQSYTVGGVIEVSDSEPYGTPSQPAHRDAVRVLDSVLQSRGSEGKILRDTSGEF